MHLIAEKLTTYQPYIILWLGAIFTFGLYSILYKENPYYRLAEHIFIGLATGLGVFLTWQEALLPKWWEPMVNKGQWWWALGLVGGLMYYFIYSQKNGWISRLIIGIGMGAGAGMAFQGFAGMYFPMIRGSFKPIIPTTWHITPPGQPGLGTNMALNNLVFVIVLVTVMAYFFFSVDHKSKGMKRTASLGRWFLMFAFGAMFGATVMARMALFIGRLDFLTTEWAPIVPLWFWIAAGGILALLIAYLMFRPKPPKKMKELPEDELEAEVVA